jgi:hypothetical protein
MAEHSPESLVGKYLGPPIAAALGGLVTWLTAGSTGAISSALQYLLALIGGIFALAFTHTYRHYFGVLGQGNKRRGTPERRDYDTLRDSLAGGNLVARLYVRLLSGSLDAVDRFLADAGGGQRAFGLKTPAPLWTIPAFHFCLLLALIYPIVTVVFVWAISGHVGPAEFALHLNANLAAWKRWLSAVLIGLSAFALWGAMRRRGWRRIGYTVACIGAFVAGIAIAASNVSTLTDVIFASTPTAGSAPTAQCVYSAGQQSCTSQVQLTVTHLVAVAVALLGTSIVTGVVAFTGALLSVLRRLGQRGEQRLHGILLLFSMIGIIVACLVAANLLSSRGLWQIAGPLLLFLGLLTLLNAPFDWISLGLTRALLRRGLELGSWWPLVVALLDAGLAAVVIAILALTMVAGVQAFDAFAVHGGGTPILPLDALFNGIEANPAAPEYWWIYALLLSTMIPSLVNLVIGGMSLLRGLPGLASVLLRRLPVGRAVPPYRRAWMALLITVQIYGGGFLGIAFQGLLVVSIIGYVMPFFRLELLDMARGRAGFNLPAQVGHLFGVSL